MLGVLYPKVDIVMLFLEPLNAFIEPQRYANTVIFFIFLSTHQCLCVLNKHTSTAWPWRGRQWLEIQRGEIRAHGGGAVSKDTHNWVIVNNGDIHMELMLVHGLALFPALFLKIKHHMLDNSLHGVKSKYLDVTVLH